MARIYKTPTKEQILNEIEQEHLTTINKMLEIQDILLNNPPIDKSFIKSKFKYILEYIDILTNAELKDYSDNYIKNAINNLYDKIFKNRRY